MAASVHRATPPPLEPRAPLCSICCDETEYETGAWCCPTCECSWPIDGWDSRGTWYEPGDRQCDATRRRHADSVHESLQGVEVRCLLAESHDGAHRTVHDILGYHWWRT